MENVGEGKVQERLGRSGMTKILSWNILHGGGRRMDAILAEISAHKPDILTLQEVRRGAHEGPLVDGLQAMGFSQIYLPETKDAKENTILVAAREPFEADVFAGDSPVHILRAEFENLTLYPLHFPQKRAQVPLFHTLLDLPVSKDALLLGDLNCGIPFDDSDTKSFANTHLFQQLLVQGWVDTWRSRHPDAREFTWVSAKRQNGFRYDHALATPALDQRISAVKYDHEPRLAKVSDHSILTVAMD